jgi:hypothetical protein
VDLSELNDGLRKLKLSAPLQLSPEDYEEVVATSSSPQTLKHSTLNPSALRNQKQCSPVSGC